MMSFLCRTLKLIEHSPIIAAFFGTEHDGHENLASNIMPIDLLCYRETENSMSDLTLCLNIMSDDKCSL